MHLWIAHHCTWDLYHYLQRLFYESFVLPELTAMTRAIFAYCERGVEPDTARVYDRIHRRRVNLSKPQFSWERADGLCCEKQCPDCDWSYVTGWPFALRTERFVVVRHIRTSAIAISERVLL